MDPGGTGDNFTDRYKDDWNYENFRKWIKHYAVKARAAFNETDPDRSVKLWRELLGDKFKTDKTLTKAAVAPLSASVPTAGEQFINESPLAFPWADNTSFDARISARCTGLVVNDRVMRNGFRQFSLPRRGNRVPKNRNLRFELTTNTPEPFDVYWKVRNGGAEASAVNQLRGEIRIDEGKLVRTETTSYTGTHYVEAYVIKNGVVVGRAYQPVIVTA